MKLLAYLVLLSVCVVLMMPTTTDAGWLRRLWRNIKKPFCKVGWGLLCPAAVGAVSGGIVAAAGGAACVAKAKSCRRRTLDEKEDLRARGLVSVPFDPDFEDYDRSGPYGLIGFQEFVETIAGVIPITEKELEGPFNDADINGDGWLSKEEFGMAPFDFGVGFLNDFELSDYNLKLNKKKYNMYVCTCYTEGVAALVNIKYSNFEMVSQNRKE